MARLWICHIGMLGQLLFALYREVPFSIWIGQHWHRDTGNDIIRLTETMPTLETEVAVKISESLLLRLFLQKLLIIAWVRSHKGESLGVTESVGDTHFFPGSTTWTFKLHITGSSRATGMMSHWWRSHCHSQVHHHDLDTAWQCLPAWVIYKNTKYYKLKSFPSQMQ